MTYTLTIEAIGRAARLLAELDGINFEAAPKNKQEWTRKGGMFGGRFRDVNEPMQTDFLEAAEAVLRDYHAYLADHELTVVERKKLGRLERDAHLGNELESAICLYTHFTGEPPYVGTSGLVLAIREAGCASKEAMPPKEGAAPKAMRPGLAALEEELRTALAPEKEGG